MHPSAEDASSIQDQNVFPCFLSAIWKQLIDYLDSSLLLTSIDSSESGSLQLGAARALFQVFSLDSNVTPLIEESSGQTELSSVPNSLSPIAFVLLPLFQLLSEPD